MNVENGGVLAIIIEDRDDGRGLYVVTEIDGVRHGEAGPMTRDLALATCADLRRQALEMGGAVVGTMH